MLLLKDKRTMNGSPFKTFSSARIKHPIQGVQFAQTNGSTEISGLTHCFIRYTRRISIQTVIDVNLKYCKLTKQLPKKAMKT